MYNKKNPGSPKKRSNPDRVEQMKELNRANIDKQKALNKIINEADTLKLKTKGAKPPDRIK